MILQSDCHRENRMPTWSASRTLLCLQTAASAAQWWRTRRSISLWMTWSKLGQLEIKVCDCYAFSKVRAFVRILVAPILWRCLLHKHHRQTKQHGCHHCVRYFSPTNWTFLFSYIHTRTIVVAILDVAWWHRRSHCHSRATYHCPLKCAVNNLCKVTTMLACWKWEVWYLALSSLLNV